MRRLMCACAAAAVLAGCEGVNIALPFDRPAPEAFSKTWELRYRRTAGAVDRYQARYDVKVRGNTEIDEKNLTELTVYTTGKTSGKEVFDRVVFRRREIERERLEISPNGRVFHETSPRPPRQPVITPNFEPEPGTDLHYIPMDELGRIAHKKGTPFHFAWYDSLCYFFPMFRPENVRAGDRWKRDVQVITGWEYLKNEFPLHVEFRLADVRHLTVPIAGSTPVCAVIEYTYYGIFDTSYSEYSGRLAAGSPVKRWRDVVEGEGLAYFDLKAGKVIWKRESYTIAVERHYERAAKPPEKGTELETYRSVNTVKFSCRLLGPGERAGERPSRAR